MGKVDLQDAGSVLKLVEEVRRSRKSFSFARSKGLISVSPDSKGVKLVFKGKPASPGAVTGLAWVIDSRKSLTLIESGDVLVLKNSTPLMIPFMAKASGFVGEEGSILCHLAIVAREFNVPCVVGVAFAKKVISTGDLVTLRGEFGLVEVLKHE